MVENNKHREDIYSSKVIKKYSELDTNEIQIIKETLIIEIS